MRNDTGVYEGGEISLYYDPMIAKLVTHAPTREQAIDAQAEALDAFVIDGIRHNIPFLAALMAHPRWRAGKLSTGFIAEEFPAASIRRCRKASRRGCWPRSRRRSIMWWASASAHISGQLNGRSGHAREHAAWCGSAKTNMRSRLRERKTGFEVRFDKAIALRSYRIGSPANRLWPARSSGTPVTVQVRAIPNGFALSHRGVETSAYVYTEREAAYARLMPVKQQADTGKR